MAIQRPEAEPRGLSGLWHRFTRTQAEVEAAELKEHLNRDGGTGCRTHRLLRPR